MKVAIFGASGGTGEQLTQQALSLGHEVTAFVRNPNQIRYRHNNLKLLQGDVLQAQEVERAVIGQDAICNALGVTDSNQPHLCSRGTQSIITAMQKYGVRRIITVTGLGTGCDEPLYMGIGSKLLLRLATLWFYRGFKDKQLQDQYLRNSDLDWVIVQPPLLTDNPPTGNYQHGQFQVRVWGKISRPDLAAFMLEQLISDRYIQKSTVIHY